MEYRQLVRQRSVLLRGDGKGTALRASTQPIAQLGGWIRFVRYRAVDLLREKLSMESDSFENRVLPFDVGVAMEMRGADAGNMKAGLEPEHYVGDLRSALDAGLERERHAGLVLVGPHRDDLVFSCLGRPAVQALSRGQKRRVAMAAVIAAGRIVEAKLRVKPILILDDVTAELDADGKAIIGHTLAATGWQVFASGVEDPFRTTEAAEAAKYAIWRVCGGKISRE